MNHQITTHTDLADLKDYLTEGQHRPTIKYSASGALLTLPAESFDVQVKNFTFTEKNSTMAWLKSLEKTSVISQPAKTPEPTANAQDASRGSQDTLIFGKDPTSHIVSIEAKDGALEVFTERAGVVSSETRENRYWMLAPRAYDASWKPLAGNLHYKYMKTYASREALYLDKGKYRQADTYSVADGKEAAMLTSGLTYYKGMKVDDVSRFHFDLETIGLLEARTHRTLLISTTFVSNGATVKKLFSVDEHESDGDMIVAFCDYMRACNPSIVSGFNIFGFDFPYLQICADAAGVDLNMGRNGSAMKISKYTSKFRKDGSQDYDYRRVSIYGREIVDMMFVAYHYDFARKYERYGLKSIIAQEGLEKPGRVFYDAGKIRDNWNIPAERAKIKEYCIDDADDSETLYKLMIPAYFYLAPSVPKSFQAINYSATGSQINAFLVRSYLQAGHSIPKGDDAQKFEGAISDANPGIYSNVFKVDVASLYPSIMLQYEIFDPKKDPRRNFYEMVQYFTAARLVNKKKGKETGDRYYKDLEQSGKIFINSAYGLLGAPGLNFNSPTNAALVTEKGREVLKKAILWATGAEYIEKEKTSE